MLQRAVKIAGVLGNMRWQVVRFENPVLAYSDHPVVVWPTGHASSEPFEQQHFAPLSAVEIRVPIAPNRAVVMNWLDLADRDDIVLDSDVAAELNAFTISQADLEWMNPPGHEPPVADGRFRPVPRFFASDYGDHAVMRSTRRAHAAAWVAKNQKRNWVNDLKLLDFGA
jgi:hypothetical protein